jgi:hypothetical protein
MPLIGPAHGLLLIKSLNHEFYSLVYALIEIKHTPTHSHTYMMSPRTHALALEAGLAPALMLEHWGSLAALTDQEQQCLAQLAVFAELIVSACAEVGDAADPLGDGGIERMIRRHFEHKQGV